MTIPTENGRRPRVEHFTTAELLAALARLGGSGTSAEVAAEALGEKRVSASQRMRAGQFLGQASTQVRQSAGTRNGYGKASVWHLRDGDEANAGSGT